MSLQTIVSSALPFSYRVVAALLIIAIFPIKNYDYYILLRVVVSILGVIAIIHIRRHKEQRHSDILTMAFVLVVALFNPVAPIHETKTFWIFIDIASAALFWHLASWASHGRPFLFHYSERKRNGVAFIAIGLFFLGMVLTTNTEPTALLVIAAIYIIAGIRGLMAKDQKSSQQ